MAKNKNKSQGQAASKQQPVEKPKAVKAPKPARPDELAGHSKFDKFKKERI